MLALGQLIGTYVSGVREVTGSILGEIFSQGWHQVSGTSGISGH